MSPPTPPAGLLPDIHLHGGLLGPAVRRDLADLNRQFLELGLTPELADDPRFAWSDVVRARLLQAERSTRDRMAACPFSLFEIALPASPRGAAPWPSRIEDASAGTALREPWNARCQAFVQFALFVAWRLADSVPFAARLALGLSPSSELELNELCPSELVQLATGPGVVRPRWPAHARFWSSLAGAAAAGSTPALQQTHCFGLCLLLSEMHESGGPSHATPPRHRPPR